MEKEVLSMPHVDRIKFAIKLRDLKLEFQESISERILELIKAIGERTNSVPEKDGHNAEKVHLLREDYNAALDAIQTLRHSTRHIDNSISLAANSEDLSAQILRDLEVQKEQLEASKRRVCVLHSFLGGYIYVISFCAY